MSAAGESKTSPGPKGAAPRELLETDTRGSMSEGGTRRSRQ